MLLSRGQISSDLASAGFSDVQATGLSGIAYRYVEGRLARRLLPLYNRIYEPLIRWSPFERTLGTFVVAHARKPKASPPSLDMIDLRGRKFLVTGGTGFIGSALVRALVHHGAQVRCLDNNSRGASERLGDVIDRVELVIGDVRDPATVARATRGVESVCHLAFINGTEFFYDRPELVLEVAVKGMMNVLDACLAEGVRDLIVASSSEVYQNAAQFRRRRTCRWSFPTSPIPGSRTAAGKSSASCWRSTTAASTSTGW